MAGLIATAINSEESVGATETILQILAPTNQRLRILEWGVSFQGTSTTAEPIQCELLRQTTAGTASGVTPVLNDDDIAQAIQTTAQGTFTAEPTSGDILQTVYVHPQTGFVYPVPGINDIMVAGGGRLGIRVVSPGATVDATAYIKFEE